MQDTYNDKENTKQSRWQDDSAVNTDSLRFSILQFSSAFLNQANDLSKLQLVYLGMDKMANKPSNTFYQQNRN